jgi:hypothetical protein
MLQLTDWFLEKKYTALTTVSCSTIWIIVVMEKDSACPTHWHETFMLMPLKRLCVANISTGNNLHISAYTSAHRGHHLSQMMVSAWTPFQHATLWLMR